MVRILLGTLVTEDDDSLGMAGAVLPATVLAFADETPAVGVVAAEFGGNAVVG